MDEEVYKRRCVFLPIKTLVALWYLEALGGEWHAVRLLVNLK